MPNEEYEMRRTLGPFSELQALADVDVNTADELDILEREDLVNAVLASQGCNCNGHAAGRQRDEYFGGDLSELVCRATPHDIAATDPDTGVVTTRTVRVKLETLQVEVDDNNELCVWIYEES
jgi:hypothetical protein